MNGNGKLMETENVIFYESYRIFTEFLRMNVILTYFWNGAWEIRLRINGKVTMETRCKWLFQGHVCWLWMQDLLIVNRMPYIQPESQYAVSFIQPLPSLHDTKRLYPSGVLPSAPSGNRGVSSDTFIRFLHTHKNYLRRLPQQCLLKLNRTLQDWRTNYYYYHYRLLCHAGSTQIHTQDIKTINH